MARQPGIRWALGVLALALAVTVGTAQAQAPIGRVTGAVGQTELPEVHGPLDNALVGRRDDRERHDSADTHRGRRAAG